MEILSKQEIEILRQAHHNEKTKRYADRIKAIILLGTGWTYMQVSEALLLDESTLRNYAKRYLESGIDGLCSDKYIGSKPKLNEIQQKELDHYLDNNTYQSIESIVDYVKKMYNVIYSVSGMTDLLHRMGFSFKKPKVVPGKADATIQQNFLDMYNKLKNTKGEDNPIYFMDGVHPQHNSVAGYGWTKKEKIKN